MFWRHSVDNGLEQATESCPLVLLSYGSCSGADRGRLEAFLRRCRKLRYCDDSQPALSELFDTADDQLFLRANGNNEHVLQTSMPEYARPIFEHDLRPRRYSRQLITKTNMLNNNDL